MADQVVDQVSVDLNDIMDVVTMYKCKFCSFSCGQPEGIGQHVQQTHVLSDLRRAESNTAQLTTSTGTSDLSIQTGSPGSVAFAVEPQPKPASRSLLRQAGLSSGIALDVSDAHGSRAELDGADRLMEAASMQSVETVVDVGQVAEAAAEGLAINKEIYLCGQCNLGFDSMENCKNHMIRDHNIMVEQEEEQEEVGTEVRVPGEVTLPSNKVSVGTQVMTRKKPGRKRKIKVEPAAQMSVEEEFAEDVAAVEPEPAEPDGLPEDYGPAEEVSPRDEEEDEDGMPKRRRRRLPTRLANLYYMGKRSPTRPVKHQPPTRIKVQPHKLRCPKAGCNARFLTQSSVDLHLACHQAEAGGAGRREVFACPRCEVTNPQWKVLRVHLWKEHAIDTDLYSCDKCDFKVDTLFRLERHAQIHSEARPYVCNVCGKGFKQASQLHNHKGIHADRSEPNKWYSSKQCDICQRTFANQKSLKIHVESVHSKERPFLCPYCNHATSRKAILDLHVRTHTGEKPFKCDMCTYMTGDHNSLRRHKMRHTGEKPYKCRYCPYSAIQAISLKTHMKNKHPGYEGIFACSLCTYQTVNEGYYNQHVLDHKNGLVPTVRTVPKANAQPQANAQRVLRPPPPLLRAAPSLQPGVITIAPVRQPMMAVNAPNVAGTRTIAVSELSKLASLGGVIQGDSNTAQLIYSALNALSQQQQQSQQEGGGGDQEQQQSAEGTNILAQPTVQSTTQDGVTTHTITFHIPPEGEEAQGSQEVQEEVMEVEREVQQDENVGDMVISEDGTPVILAVRQPPTQQSSEPPQEQQLVVSETQQQQQQQQQQHVTVHEEGMEVTYSNEEVHPEAIQEQLVMVETVDETASSEEVATYEAIPVETVAAPATPPSSDTLTIAEVVAESGGSDEVVTQVDFGDTIIMEVVDADGNVQEEQVQYCTIASEGD